MDLTATLIEEIIRPILDRRKVKLYGVRVSGRISRPLIQIFVDWEQEPITIEECARITRELMEIFDSQERFVRDYRLEVSSPGLTAPLREIWQFRRNIGKTIQIGTPNEEKQVEIRDVTPDGRITIMVENETEERSLGELAGATIVLFPKSKNKAGRKKNEARGR